MKRLIVDLDGTLALDESGVPYPEKRPNAEVVARLRKYKDNGFTIVIATARNMQTFNGSIGKINALTLPTIITWLTEHGIAYDEIYVGKPWCGHEGFYIDDRAIRPSEFVRLSYTEITDLLARESVIRQPDCGNE